MSTIQTILYPTDFSSCSSQAFQLACSLARDYGARIIVLHVQLPPVIVYGEGVIPTDPLAYARQLHAQLADVKISDPRVQLEHRLIDGDAATEILRLADEKKCDLIVMGTHGRTGLGRLLMGSVAEEVVRKAKCPVLTLRCALPSAAPLPSTSSGTASDNDVAKLCNA
ncbi:MAG TPA: universal stress protein [Gemmataceae bacterium]|jgi:nucleotide-binding universal stress UspA family protein|nr:universal stress protein [Gemmataceae bacterium]